MKKWENQKAGKKRMKALFVGRVSIPTEAFNKVLSVNTGKSGKSK